MPSSSVQLSRPLKSLEKKPSENSSIDLDEVAFAELIAYIDERLDVEDPAVQKLSDLVEFFSFKLQELEMESGKINATRLKDSVSSFS